MRRIILLLLFHATINFANAEHVSDTSKQAIVNVVVTDRNGKPSGREQIIFRGMNSNSIHMGITGNNGKFSLQLPAGDSYLVSVKSLNDTTRYGTIEIPALETDQYFTEPFKVDIQFEEARQYTLDDVHFDFGKATLRPESFKELEELLNYLKRKVHVRIEIAGHTDNIGNVRDNLLLSQQRANAIRNFLLKKGIDASRVIAKGYGAKEPVETNDTEEGRQMNRRTEVRIL